MRSPWELIGSITDNPYLQNYLHLLRLQRRILNQSPSANQLIKSHGVFADLEDRVTTKWMLEIQNYIELLSQENNVDQNYVSNLIALIRNNYDNFLSFNIFKK